VGRFCSLEGPMHLRKRPNLVQQPCSNPDEYSEKVGKVLRSESVHLQAFCGMQKSQEK